MRALIDSDPSTGLAPGVGRGNTASDRTLRVALLLSVLAHVAAMWGWHPQLRPTFELTTPSEQSGPLQLRLEPETSTPAMPIPPEPRRRSEPSTQAPPAPQKRELAPPKPRPTPPTPRTRPSTPEPMTQPAPPAEPPQYATPQTAPALPPAPETATKAAPGGDLSSYIASRRRARQGSDEASRPVAPALAEPSEAERARRIAEANLGVGRTPSHGQDLTGGGIFQITRLGYDYAEYLFYGWNVDIRRNATQMVTVRKGAHADIRKAVVRSMIDIIRRHEQGDFLWESRRLGRNVNLSARPADDAGLEDFLMKEFFDDPARPPVSRAP